MNGYIHMYCIAWSKIIKQWVSILVRCVTWRSFLNRFYAEDAFEQSDQKTRASRISVISCLIVRCSHTTLWVLRTLAPWYLWNLKFLDRYKVGLKRYNLFTSTSKKHNRVLHNLQVCISQNIVET